MCYTKFVILFFLSFIVFIAILFKEVKFLNCLLLMCMFLFPHYKDVTGVIFSTYMLVRFPQSIVTELV